MIADHLVGKLKDGKLKTGDKGTDDVIGVIGEGIKKGAEVADKATFWFKMSSLAITIGPWVLLVLIILALAGCIACCFCCCCMKKDKKKNDDKKSLLKKDDVLISKPVPILKEDKGNSEMQNIQIQAI